MKIHHLVRLASFRPSGAPRHAIPPLGEIITAGAMFAGVILVFVR